MKFYEILSAVLYVLGWFAVLIFEEPELKYWEKENMALAVIWPIIVSIYFGVSLADVIQEALREKQRIADLKKLQDETLLKEVKELRRKLAEYKNNQA